MKPSAVEAGRMRADIGSPPASVVPQSPPCPSRERRPSLSTPSESANHPPGPSHRTAAQCKPRPHLIVRSPNAVDRRPHGGSQRDSETMSWTDVAFPTLNSLISSIVQSFCFSGIKSAEPPCTGRRGGLQNSGKPPPSSPNLHVGSCRLFTLRCYNAVPRIRLNRN